MPPEFILENELSIKDFTRLCRGGIFLVLGEERKKRIAACAEKVKMIAGEGRVVYGINTGFGGLAGKRIDGRQLEELQVNLIRSHACGVGRPLGPRTVKGVMLLLINSLSRGYSGVRPETVDLLVKIFNSPLIPRIPAKGSLGASGDLAPLAHLALVLIGEGRVFCDGAVVRGKEALEKIGCRPLRPGPKEGLALINGTHVMCAQAALAVWRAERIISLADKAGAMSMEALRANDSFLDPAIHRLKNHPGQAATVRNIAELIAGSRLINSIPTKVQDAYCLRCIPQVHGASRDLYDYARRTVETEMNAVTDNPLIMEDGRTVSGGNFHGQALAFAMDSLAIAVAEMADISERRISRLLDGKLNDGLPEFLMDKNGVNSGLMIAQYTAASLVAENKILAHPASVDSIPTSANQEDHVSMGSISARKIHEICYNTEQVLLFEFLCAAQALDFAGPEKAGAKVRKLHRTIREVVPHADSDRVWADDIAKICALVKSEKLE